MEDLYRAIGLAEVAAIEEHIWRLRELIAHHEKLMISREMAGSVCPVISWQIRSSYLTTLALYENLAGKMLVEIGDQFQRDGGVAPK